MVRLAARILITVALIAGAAQAALAEKRVALVVGNDKYANLPARAQLERAVNDARAVTQALKDVGFAVAEIEDASRSSFNAKWQQFLLTVAEGDIVAFYFSGHGIEIEGLNFLIPSDIPQIEYGRQEQIKRESIDVAQLLLDLKKRKPGVSLIVLDACREHPLIPDEFRSPGAAPGGLAKMDAPNGTFIMYSAGAGQTALDRLPKADPDAVNSVFTRKLLPLMRQKGLELTELAREVRKQVHALAATVSHAQTPAYYDGVLGKFCLAGCDADAPPVASSGGESLAVKKSGRLPGTEPEKPKLAVVAPPKPVVSEGACDGLLVSVAQSSARPCIKPGSGESFEDCPDCPEMVIAPAGSFTMGSPKGEPQRSDDEGPQHRVTIPKPFAVGKFAVTFAEWDACAAAYRCSHRPMDLGWGRADRPVINVSWDDAQAYVKWLSGKTGKTYRLLSEAEFEYAARAGSATPFWWGTSISTTQANYNGDYVYVGGGQKGEFRAKTVPVKSFQPNPWGLYQVHGNVWTWIQDCYVDNYKNAPMDGAPAKETTGCSRVLRGGSWPDDPRLLRAARRLRGVPSMSIYFLGFRVARTLD